MDGALSHRDLAEEQIVAELALLGVNYLSRNIDLGPIPQHPTHQLIAGLIRQPSSRVRTALIALLLLHPEFDQAVPAALAALRANNRVTLKCLYTAAVILQRKYGQELRATQASHPSFLFDWFGEELGVLPAAHPDDQLQALAARHQILTGGCVNWSGTYENVIHHLMKQKGTIPL
jgi:hypothetical protein